MENTVELYGFASVETPEVVKAFVEELTGEGSVSGVEVGKSKASPRAHARVGFRDAASANAVISLAESGLWYGTSYLKAKKLGHSSIDDTTLHFGSRVSKNEFSVLWRRENVCVGFGEGLRTLCFMFSFESVEYKLELCFDNIWQTELRRTLNQPSKFLLLQVCFFKGILLLYFYALLSVKMLGIWCFLNTLFNFE